MSTPPSPTATTGHNMAMLLRDTRMKTERTLALPPGLTHDEVLTYVEQYRGPHELVTGVYRYT